jgi:S-adenosylmethionine decarboxylase
MSGMDSVSFMALWGQVAKAQPKGFEGPEKRLEIVARLSPDEDPRGFLTRPQSVWEEIIAELHAKIVAKVSTGVLDAYVLTESSLFVEAHRVILITCGTTTLLSTLPKILTLVADLNAEVEWASFMRKNFSYPWEQIGPHASMEEEYRILKECLPAGKPFIFGPIDSDHYFFFVFDDVHRPTVEADVQISVTMFGLDQDVAANFFSDSFSATSDITAAIREKSGVSRLVKNLAVSDLQFAPCGYSINAVAGSTYRTMHITPEEHCSFASFETSEPVTEVSGVLNDVLSVFRPKTFTVLLLADPGSTLGAKIQSRAPIGLEEVAGYAVNNRTTNEFGPGYFVMKVTFSRR